ncbi:MAG: hypothetical protein F6J97_26330 [Leptolyngbya sp. SIO4C1]|nr:hypothetical protein [Leptolyngbya sp. SIO4C1]
MNFSDQQATVKLAFSQYAWKQQLDSAAAEWAGPGAIAPELLSSDAPEIVLAPYNFVLYHSAA